MLTDQTDNLYRIEQVPIEYLPLVDKFFSANKYKVRMGKLDWVYWVREKNEIVAAVRLIHQANKSLLMRNLFVTPSHRGRGLARQLVNRISELIQPNDCYCYALPHLQDFYSSCSYSHFAPEQVPSDIRDLYLRYKSRNRDWVLMGYINCS